MLKNKLMLGFFIINTLVIFSPFAFSKDDAYVCNIEPSTLDSENEEFKLKKYAHFINTCIITAKKPHIKEFLRSNIFMGKSESDDNKIATKCVYFAMESEGAWNLHGISGNDFGTENINNNYFPIKLNCISGVDSSTASYLTEFNITFKGHENFCKSESEIMAEFKKKFKKGGHDNRTIRSQNMNEANNIINHRCSNTFIVSRDIKVKEQTEIELINELNRRFGKERNDWSDITISASKDDRGEVIKPLTFKELDKEDPMNFLGKLDTGQGIK